MRYFEIEIKRSYENNMIAPAANGDNILDAEYYFSKISKFGSIEYAPVFEHFTLESYDEKKYWEWIKLDVYRFIKKANLISGWLISGDLKLLLDNFDLAKPYYLYPSMLLYKDDKLDYYIFNFFNKKTSRSSLAQYINFSKSVFFDSNNKIFFSVDNEQNLLNKQEMVLIESEYNIVNIPIEKIEIKLSVDFLPLQNLLGVNLVSERLKNAIEAMGIEGFEFSELDYEVSVAQ